MTLLNDGGMTFLKDGGGFLFVDDFFNGGEVAEGVVVGDVFDEGGGWLEFVAAGEVGTGDLQAVEEDAGSLVVDVAGGDAAEDVVEGDLDGVAVVDGLHFEDADAAGERGVGEALAVVVVAEVLGAQGGRAAAVAVGVDVAAEVAALWVEFGMHGYPLYFGRKVFRIKGL
jgi:hypothetical protein